MVSGHCKLSMLFLDDEVVQIVLLREFIAESQTVVEKPEADHDVTLVVGLFKGYGQFVVMVPDFVFFSPYGCPGFVERSCLSIADNKSGHQICLAVELVFISTFCPFKVRFLLRIFFFQFKSQCTGFDDSFPLEQE